LSGPPAPVLVEDVAVADPLVEDGVVDGVVVSVVDGAEFVEESVAPGDGEVVASSVKERTLALLTVGAGSLCTNAAMAAGLDSCPQLRAVGANLPSTGLNWDKGTGAGDKSTETKCTSTGLGCGMRAQMAASASAIAPAPTIAPFTVRSADAIEAINLPNRVVGGFGCALAEERARRPCPPLRRAISQPPYAEVTRTFVICPKKAAPGPGDRDPLVNQPAHPR
jgi:hypothetical protein